MLNAAVIGLGVGEQHAQYFNSHRHYKLKGVCDLDKDKATACAIEYGAKPMSWVEILADQKLMSYPSLRLTITMLNKFVKF